MNDATDPKSKSSRWKGILTKLGLALLGLALLAGVWVFLQIRAFDASMDQVYAVPIAELTASSDPEIVARGRHLSESISACSTSECHGADLSGGRCRRSARWNGHPQHPPAGYRRHAPTGARAADPASARRPLRRFMPSHEIGWLPGADVAAVVAYVRSVPPVQKDSAPMHIGVLGKVLDRSDKIVLDVARRIDHTRPTDAPLTPEPTAKYGSYIARACTGCHGETLSGGPIPGAPASMAVPANLTPHETGLGPWSYDDFGKVLDTGLRPDGRKLSSDMPYESLSKSNPTERKALWAYLQSVPSKPFGNR